MRRNTLITTLACMLLATSAGASSWRDDLEPISGEDWNRERAAHLLARAGFGGTPEEVAALASLPPEQAVRKLVRWQDQPSAPSAPFAESKIFPSDDFVPPQDGDLETIFLKAALLRRGLGVKISWDFDEPWLQPVFDQFFYLLFANILEMGRVAHWQADRMLKTQRPLEEKLALFWHGHFATSNEKVRDYRKMMRQWDLFRAHGNGSFRQLLLGICRDPAMLVYLDGQRNVRGQPNENFAREILELFSLGVGNYSETDIKEAARAFTGWGLDDNDFDRSFWRHDHGQKTVLGRTGRLDGEDVVDAILAQPAAAHFISEKLYRYFVREDPSPELQRELAKALRTNGYQIAPLLEKIFLSRDFYSSETVGSRVKSPVELMVSTYRKLGLQEVPSAPFFANTTGDMGQALYQPPNVAGWKGGRTWINPSSLILRQNFARHVLFPQEISPLEKSLLEILVAGAVGQETYEQLQRMAAEGDRTSAPQMSMADMGFAQVEQAGGEAFNFAWAIYNGVEKAVGAVHLDFAGVARFSLTEMLAKAGIDDVEGAVAYLTDRFLDRAPRPEDRALLVAHLRSLTHSPSLDLESADTERGLRELLHLILSMPEYQLS